MRTWPQVEAELDAAPAGTRVVVPKTDIGTPQAAGASRSTGLPVGQMADWRLPRTIACRSVHVQEFPQIYVAHLDQVDPGCAPAAHLFVDAPIVAACGLGGALIGACMRRVPGALVGLGVGLVAGALLHRATHAPPSS